MAEEQGLKELLALTGSELNWDDFDSSCEKKDTAVSILNEVIRTAVSRAREPKFLLKVIKDSVAENIEACLDAVDLNFVNRSDNQSQRESLRAEPEVSHAPVDIDSWARGVLAVKVVSKTKFHGRSSRASTIASPLKKVTREASVSDGDGLKATNKARARDSVKTTCLYPIVDRSNRKKLTQKEVELEQRLRDELEARKTAQEVLRQADANDLEEKKRLQTLQHELRGKEYGYDQSGQVVVLNRLDPDRLPPSSVSLKFRFNEKNKSPENPANLVAKRNNGESPSKKGQASAKAGVKANVPEFVKKTTSGLPSMMESMKIVPGVTIKEGDLVKAGPKSRDPNQCMTRSEYFSQKQFESTMTEHDDTEMNNTWGENTFNGQEFGILQMIQSAEDPLLSAKKTRSQSVIADESSKSQVLGKPAEDINLVLTRAPDWGENSPVAAKVNLPRPPVKTVRQSPHRTPRRSPGKISKESSFNR